MFKISVLSEVQAIEQSHTADRPTAVISITSTISEDAKIDTSNKNIGPVFRMKFNDLEQGENGMFGLPAPKREDFVGLKDFIDSMPSETECLIIHCGAGISRSAAVAAAIDEYLHLGYDFRSDEHLHPNLLVYQLSCEEFGIRKTEAEMEEIFREREDVSWWGCSGCEVEISEL